MEKVNMPRGIRNDGKDKNTLQCRQPNWQSMLQEVMSLTHDTLAQVAAKLQMSYSTVRRVFNGTLRKPSEKTFNKILAFWCAEYYLPQNEKLQYVKIKHDH